MTSFLVPCPSPASANAPSVTRFALVSLVSPLVLPSMLPCKRSNHFANSFGPYLVLQLIVMDILNSM